MRRFLGVFCLILVLLLGSVPAVRAEAAALPGTAAEASGEAQLWEAVSPCARGGEGQKGDLVGKAALSALSEEAVTLLGEREVAVSLEQPGFSVRFRAEGYELMENGAVAEDPEILVPLGSAAEGEEIVCEFLPLKAGQSQLFFVFSSDEGNGPSVVRVSVTVTADLADLAVNADKSAYLEGETAQFFLTAGGAGPLTGEIVWLEGEEEIGRGARLTLTDLQKGTRELTARVTTRTGSQEVSYVLRVSDLIILPETVRAIAAPIGILLLVGIIILYAFRRIRKDPLETLDERLEQSQKRLKEVAEQAGKGNEKRTLKALRYAAFLAQEAALKAESCAADEVYEAEDAAAEIRRAERILSAACRAKALSFGEYAAVAARAGEMLAHSRERLAVLIGARARIRRERKEFNDRRARQEVSELKFRRGRSRADERAEELAFLNQPEDSGSKSSASSDEKTAPCGPTEAEAGSASAEKPSEELGSAPAERPSEKPGSAPAEAPTEGPGSAPAGEAVQPGKADKKQSKADL